MVFSSPAFLFIFFPVFLILYFSLGHKLRNGFVLLASIIFYVFGAGPLVMVAVLLLLINWISAIRIAKLQNEYKSAKVLFFITIIINISPLIFFKYLVFLAGLMRDLSGPDYLSQVESLHIILPLGISFYVFHFLSYIVDVYYGKIFPEKNLKKFSLYIALFPHLIAGPLVRYSEVKQQLNIKHRRLIHSDVFWGMVIFSIGLAKKTLIADPLGGVVDSVHHSSEQVTFYAAWLSAICYSFQIYFDFSGYTDMAIGMARMIGFRFPRNFNRPYAAHTISEFWRRWHMTLSRWFRDYVYIPLGGNRTSELKIYRNLFIVFGLCALWHGAAYTYLIWGIGHGLLLALERAGWSKLDKIRLFSIPVFILVTVLWVPFRSVGLPETEKLLSAMFYLQDGTKFWTEANLGLADPKVIFLLILSFGICLLSDKKFYRFRASFFKRPMLVGAYCTVLYLLSCVSVVEHGFNPFIYFQF